MADKKEDKKDEAVKIKEDKKETVKKTTKAKEPVKVEKTTKVKETVKKEKKDSPIKVEKDKKEEEKVTETVTTEEKEKNLSSLVNIVAITVIIITLIAGVLLVSIKPSPKKAAKDYLNMSIRNPIEAFLKYGFSEFEEEILRARSKYVSFEILEISEVRKEGAREVVEVVFMEKGPNEYKIREDVEKNLKDRDIAFDSENYNTEYLKEFKQLLKERRDQLEEYEDTIQFYRNPGERNWKIDLGLN